MSVDRLFVPHWLCVAVVCRVVGAIRAVECRHAVCAIVLQTFPVHFHTCVDHSRHLLSLWPRHRIRHELDLVEPQQGAVDSEIGSSARHKIRTQPALLHEQPMHRSMSSSLLLSAVHAAIVLFLRAQAPAHESKAPHEQQQQEYDYSNLHWLQREVVDVVRERRKFIRNKRTQNNKNNSLPSARRLRPPDCALDRLSRAPLLEILSLDAGVVGHILTARACVGDILVDRSFSRVLTGDALVGESGLGDVGDVVVVVVVSVGSTTVVGSIAIGISSIDRNEPARLLARDDNADDVAVAADIVDVSLAMRCSARLASA